MFLFLQHAVGLPRLLLGLAVLSPMLVANRLGLVANQRAKESLLAWFFNGWQTSRFAEVANHFSANQLDRYVREDARQRLIDHQDAGHEVIVVSASAQDWLRSWCEQQGLQLIATRLSSQEGVLSGKLQGANCTGAEKVARLNQSLQTSDYQAIFAYGDSRGDEEMLALADFPNFRVFKD